MIFSLRYTCTTSSCIVDTIQRFLIKCFYYRPEAKFGVWGKVIFSECVSFCSWGDLYDSVHGGGDLYDITSCLATWSHGLSGKGVSVPDPMFLPVGLCRGVLSRGVSLRGSLSSWGLYPWGVSVHGGSLPKGLLLGITPPPQRPL